MQGHNHHYMVQPPVLWYILTRPVPVTWGPVMEQMQNASRCPSWYIQAILDVSLFVNKTLQLSKLSSDGVWWCKMPRSNWLGSARKKYLIGKWLTLFVATICNNLLTRVGLYSSRLVSEEYYYYHLIRPLHQYNNMRCLFMPWSWGINNKISSLGHGN